MSEPDAGKQRALTARLLPFALPAAASVLVGWPLAREGGGPSLVLAAVLTGAVLASAFVLPWRRMPGWTRAVPPLVYCGAVAALRDATGGAESGFMIALVLPIFWSALYGTWRRFAVVVAGGVAALAVPIIVVGAPLYPVGEWRRLAAWLLVAPAVGWTVQRLVGEAAESARAADRRARELADRESRLAVSERTIAAVARLTRTVPIGADARGRLCDAVRELAGATSVALVETDEAGGLTTTASAGVPVPGPAADHAERGHAAEALRRGRATYVRDGETYVGHGERIGVQAGPPASGTSEAVLHQPVLRGDEPVGVLVVTWRHPQAGLEEPVARGLELLAAEAAAIIERADLLAQARAQARFDPLTRLANRRAWDEALSAELTRARRTGHSVAVGILDLDRFKDYNDRHGHPRGDDLLVEAAALWRGRLRDIDLLARWGGEEFTVLLPDCGLEEARRVVDRVRAVTPQGQTCSAGVAVWDGAESADVLLARADDALYAAKSAGRNRTVLADP